MGDRCTGHCCYEFWVPVGSLEQLQQEVIDFPEDKERATIAKMLIPVHTAHKADHNYVGQYFKCKNFVSTGGRTGYCGDYENRPKMCWDYPYGKRCQQEACEYTDARRVRLPLYKEEAKPK